MSAGLLPALLAWVPLGLPTPTQDGAAVEAAAPADGELAAVAEDLVLPMAELDALLLSRHGRSPDGRAALRDLVQLRLLEALAAEADLTIPVEAVRTRMGQIDREIRAGGDEGGLPAFLAESEVDPETFREVLRLALVHEALTRRALGKPDDAPVTGEEQTAWLEGQLQAQGLQEFSYPWPDGVVARCGPVVLTPADLARHLGESLPREEVEEACHRMLLERRLRQRMPDLAEAAFEVALKDEIERRRLEAEADPRYEGMDYGSLLSAQGLDLAALRREPGVRVTALARLWILRAYPDEQELRRVYEDERERFDAEFGEAVEVWVLYLRAARFENEYNPRTFEDAEEELLEMSRRIEDVNGLKRLAALHSEDPRTRADGGRMGWTTRGSPSVPAPIRAAVFDAVDRARVGGGEVAGTVLGPVRIQGGVVLIGLGARRPAPTWETMVVHVRGELQRRLLEETLPAEAVTTFLDAEGGALHR